MDYGPSFCLEQGYFAIIAITQPEYNLKFPLKQVVSQFGYRLFNDERLIKEPLQNSYFTSFVVLFKPYDTKDQAGIQGINGNQISLLEDPSGDICNRHCALSSGFKNSC
jgi:hypothetical protein